MTTSQRNRRAAGRRRAWGRGPMILRFEPLEGRELLTLAAGSIAGTLAAAASTTNAQPDLVLAKLTAPTNLDWDEEFTLRGSVANVGAGPTTADSRLDLYASPAATLTSDAVYVGSVTVPAGLAAGATYDFVAPMTSPSAAFAGLGSAPSYYLVAAADGNAAVAESDETNNANQGLQGVDAAFVTITPKAPSNLVAAGMVVEGSPTTWGGTIQVGTTIRNNGAGEAPATVARLILAPSGTDPFGPAGYSVGTIAIPAISAYQSATVSKAITLPSEPPRGLENLGNFSLTLEVDSDETADPVVRSHVYQGPGVDWTALTLTPRPAPADSGQRPDLRVVAVENPSTVAWGGSFAVKAKVENDGAGASKASKVRFYLLQGDDSTAPALAIGDVELPALDSTGFQIVEGTVKLPGRVPTGLDPNLGAGRIVAQVDPDHALDEVDLSDNTLASTPIALRVVGSDGTSTPVITLAPAPTAPTPTPTPTPTVPVVSADARAALAAANRQRMIARVTQIRQAQADRARLRVYSGPGNVAQQPNPSATRPLLRAWLARQGGLDSNSNRGA